MDAELIQPFSGQVDLWILVVAALPSTIMNLGARADSEGAFFPWNDGTERYIEMKNEMCPARTPEDELTVPDGRADRKH
jgi:hypothetical protein